jgi:hypothetical protein
MSDGAGGGDMSRAHPREVLGGKWRNGQWYSDDNAVDVPRRLTMGGVKYHLCYITEEEKRVLHRMHSMRDIAGPAGLDFVTDKDSGDIEVDTSDAVAKAPKGWISEPSHAKSLLVYVDDPTAALLKRLDLHGSGVDKHDHFGPDRIPSYQGDGAGGGGGDGGGDGGAGGGDDMWQNTTSSQQFGVPYPQVDAMSREIAELRAKQEATAMNPIAPTSSFNAATAIAGANTAMGMDVGAFANQLVGDPAAFFNDDMRLSNKVPTIDANTAGTNINPADSRYTMDNGALATETQTGSASTAATVQQDPTATVEADLSFDKIAEANMQAAKGEVREEAIITPVQADMVGLATGVNADGTVNYVGEALNKYATQNIATVIDTSTISGKLLAETLGEGNYTDSKATMLGQLDILSKEFVDSVTGEPKIPTWAAATARNVSRIAAFKGMTGTAATAAMSAALMEASLPVAQADAQFFQTLTIKNLDNKQQSIINTANVLSKMEMVNLDYRMQAAVENSKNFMTMDLTNLNNEQQARVINTQARVQSILEDSKAVNTARMFNATNENEMNKFYDNLNASISTFNASQKNAMEQFNAGEINDTRQFNASLENNREQFYKNMQYNIDIANTKWRQQVTLANNEMLFQAAATDVKNMVGLSVEQLNQLWDRSDALLDFTWKSSETQAERESNLAIAKLQSETSIKIGQDQTSAQKSAAKSSATGAIIGGVASAAISIGGAIIF